MEPRTLCVIRVPGPYQEGVGGEAGNVGSSAPVTVECES